MVSRLDRGPVGNWWWTIDRWYLGAFLSLMLLGIVLSFAASPAVAVRIGLEPYHFVIRQIVFMAPALIAMIGVSFLDERQIRRLAIVMLAASLVLMLAALYFGIEVKGARRWINLVGISVQPSEFMKPAFVIVCAWLFAEGARRPDIPGNLFAMILLGLAVSLLVAQPDLGQTMLLVATWGIMFFMAGLSWMWIVALGATAIGGLGAAYEVFPHVAKRIDKFMTGEGDTFQVDTAREALMRGGWLGQGPGEGVIKRVLPDSHTDFVFAVAGEEFGLILCAIILLLFAFVVLRGLKGSLDEQDDFSRYAIAGLVTQFGLQSIINMGVNLQLLPAKGMTLPFISYGGSSLIAVAIAMGMVLALTRRRPSKRTQITFAPRAAGPLPAE